MTVVLTDTKFQSRDRRSALTVRRGRPRRCRVTDRLRAVPEQFVRVARVDQSSSLPRTRHMAVPRYAWFHRWRSSGERRQRNNRRRMRPISEQVFVTIRQWNINCSKQWKKQRQFVKFLLWGVTLNVENVEIIRFRVIGRTNTPVTVSI